MGRILIRGDVELPKPLPRRSIFTPNFDNWGNHWERELSSSIQRAETERGVRAGGQGVRQPDWSSDEPRHYM